MIVHRKVEKPIKPPVLIELSEVERNSIIGALRYGASGVTLNAYPILSTLLTLLDGV